MWGALIGSAQSTIITYRLLPNIVAKQNSFLRVAKSKILVAQGLATQSGKLSNPELSFGIEGNHELEEGRIDIGFAQRFPITDRLSLERKIADIEVDAAHLEYSIAERAFLMDARQRFINLHFLKQKRAFYREQLVVLDGMSQYISEAATKGQLSPLDAAQAEVEAVEFESELELIASEVVAEETALKLALGLDLSKETILEGGLPTSGINKKKFNHQLNPEFQLAVLKIESAKQGINLAHANRFEDVSVGITAGLARVVDAPHSPDKEATLGFGFSIPLPLWNKNEGNIQAATARAEASQIGAENVIFSLSARLQKLEKQHAIWAQLTQSIQDKLLPKVEQQVADLKGAYYQGQEDLVSVFKAQKQRIDLKISHLEALQKMQTLKVNILNITQP